MRLIDAEALVEDYRRREILVDSLNEVDALDDYFVGLKSGFNTAAVVAENFPQIEAKPVRRGEWIVDVGACEPDYMKCSVCGWIIEYYGGLEEEWNFCPHCGAQMEVDDGQQAT